MRTMVTTVTAVMTAMTATTARERGIQGQHNQVSSYGEGGEYRVRERAEGESVDESARWSGKDTDGVATDEDATTAEGAGRDGKPWTARVGGTQKSGADGRSGDAMAGGGDTGKASSEALSLKRYSPPSP